MYTHLQSCSKRKIKQNYILFCIVRLIYNGLTNTINKCINNMYDDFDRCSLFNHRDLYYNNSECFCIYVLPYHIYNEVIKRNKYFNYKLFIHS